MIAGDSSKHARLPASWRLRCSIFLPTVTTRIQCACIKPVDQPVFCARRHQSFFLVAYARIDGTDPINFNNLKDGIVLSVAIGRQIHCHRRAEGLCAQPAVALMCWWCYIARIQLTDLNYMVFRLHLKALLLQFSSR